MKERDFAATLNLPPDECLSPQIGNPRQGKKSSGPCHLETSQIHRCLREIVSLIDTSEWALRAFGSGTLAFFAVLTPITNNSYYNTRKSSAWFKLTFQGANCRCSPIGNMAWPVMVTIQYVIQSPSLFHIYLKSNRKFLSTQNTGTVRGALTLMNISLQAEWVPSTQQGCFVLLSDNSNIFNYGLKRIIHPKTACHDWENLMGNVSHFSGHSSNA